MIPLLSFVSLQIPADAMVPPLAAATVACWFLSAVLIRRTALAASSATGVADLVAAEPTACSSPNLAAAASEEAGVADSGDDRRLLVPAQPPKRESGCGGEGDKGDKGDGCGLWGWDVWVGGALPFAAGWLGLSALFITLTAANGCRRVSVLSIDH